jgi:hypothetical protein
MFAFTPDRGRKPVESEEATRAEFERFEIYFMLEDEVGATLLAAGEGFGPYTLEWFPATRTGKHLKATEELKRAEVLASMLTFFRGDPDWRGPFDWQEADDPKPTLLARLIDGSLFGSLKSKPPVGKSADDELQ